MLKRLITASLALLATGAVFAQAYKWVDADGVVHFSDRPHPGAERIYLPQSRTTPRPTNTPPAASSRTNAASAAASSASTTDAAEPETPFSYESITIASPGEEETLWNIEGVLSVTVTVQPALQDGHRLRAYFDGRPQDVSGTSFQLQEVWRGAHNLQVEVLDQTGQLMIRSLPNRFYVQQNAIGGP